METKANYVLIGSFTILTGLALLIFGLWAAKYSSDRTWQNYRVVFREAVTGLSVGSPVQYNGIAIGSITQLTRPERPAPSRRTYTCQLNHTCQERHARQTGNHQPDRPIHHPIIWRHPRITIADKHL